MGPEPHKAAIENSLVRLKAARDVHDDIETRLQRVSGRRSLVGQAWNEMHEAAEESARCDAGIRESVNKFESVRRNASVALEEHKDMLSRLLAPLPIPKISANPPPAMVEAAWKIILQPGGGIATIRARNPALLDGVYNEENEILKRELVWLKANIPRGAQNPKSSSSPGREDELQYLLAQNKSAMEEVEKLRETLKNQDHLIVCLSKEQSDRKSILDSLNKALVYSGGRIEGFQRDSAINLRKVGELEQKVKCLEDEVNHSRKENQRLVNVASVRGPKLESFDEDDLARFRAMSDTLVSLEVAVDKLAKDCLPEVEYVRSVAGRLGCLKQLSLTWKRNATRTQFSEGLNRSYASSMYDLLHEKAAWEDAKSQFEKDQKRLGDDLKIEKSKLVSALNLCRTMENQGLQSLSKQEAHSLRLAEISQKDATVKTARIEELVSENQKLKVARSQMKSCIEEKTNNFTNGILLAIEFAKSRNAHVRRIGVLHDCLEDQRKLLDISESTYADHMDRAKTFVLLCCSWPEFGNSVNIAAFNDVMYKLLSTSQSFKDDIEDASQQSWFIETPNSIRDKVQFTYAVAESEAFPMSLKLYIIVDGFDHCTQVGFNLVQGLGRVLTLCHDSFAPQVYMMTVDMYVNKLVLVDLTHDGKL